MPFFRIDSTVNRFLFFNFQGFRVLLQIVEFRQSDDSRFNCLRYRQSQKARCQIISRQINPFRLTTLNLAIFYFRKNDQVPSFVLHSPQPVSDINFIEFPQIPRSMAEFVCLCLCFWFGCVQPVPSGGRAIPPFSVYNHSVARTTRCGSRSLLSSRMSPASLLISFFSFYSSN